MASEKQRRQLQVSPTEGEFRLIIRLAEFWGESHAGILMAGFRRALPSMLEDYKRGKEVLEEEEIHCSLSDEFIRALAEKRKPDVLTVQKLADSLGVPSESLAELVAECCCCETEEKKSRAKSQR